MDRYEHEKIDTYGMTHNLCSGGAARRRNAREDRSSRALSFNTRHYRIWPALYES